MQTPTPFIVICGLDGSSKTTQASLLRDYLTRENIDTVVLHFPSDTLPGQVARQSLKSDFSLKTDDPLSREIVTQALMTADRRAKSPWIRERIYNGKGVIAVRWWQCGRAYGEAAGLPGPLLDSMEPLSVLPVPHLQFLIDVSPETAVARITLRNQALDRFETLAFQRKVWTVYQRMVENGQLIRIDGSQTREIIHSKIVEHVVKYLVACRQPDPEPFV
jgi:dTMP kinase